MAAFYCAAMNETAVEAAGTSPLDPVLAICKQARDPAQRAHALAVLAAQFGVNAFFGIYSSPDKKDANHSICGVT